MYRVFLRILIVLSFPIIVLSGCAKEQVKPDEGIAPVTPPVAANRQPIVQPEVVSRSDAADKAAAERAAAERAAAERAAAERAAAERAAAEKAAPEMVTTTYLKSINFEFDSYALSQASRDILYTNAEYLLKKYKGKVKLEGHCDERGSDEYNLALGENRAKSAMNYLLTLGVPAEQLSVISFGKERPLDNGHTEEAWAKNRRVEFTVVK